MKKNLYWAPRALGIAGIIFISLFALDVFQQGIPFSQILLAFSIHLIPSFLLLGVFLIAWKYELVGGIIFALISIIPFLLFNNPVQVNLILSIPFLITGILFILDYYLNHNKNKKLNNICE